jgi:hypothetical protein
VSGKVNPFDAVSGKVNPFDSEGLVSEGYTGLSDQVLDDGQVERDLAAIYEGWGFAVDPEDGESEFRYDEYDGDDL